MRPIGRSLTCCYSTKLENIDAFCIKAKSMLEDADLSEQGFPAEILIREAMTNAMLHGNHLQEDKKVSVAVKLRGNLLIIRVCDEGPGFDWHRSYACADEPLKESGRGLKIYTHYASRLAFNRRGNGIILSRRITRRGKMAELDITRDGSKATVTPAVNIVATKVSGMRTQIKGLIDEGCTSITIDLKDVEIVDSTGIGLLIAVHNSLTKAGGTVAVVNASKDILELFKAMRLDQHFSITGA
jgi:serine/threonine-protein kinase RsbW